MAQERKCELFVTLHRVMYRAACSRAFYVKVPCYRVQTAASIPARNLDISKFLRRFNANMKPF